MLTDYWVVIEAMEEHCVMYKWQCRCFGTFVPESFTNLSKQHNIHTAIIGMKKHGITDTILSTYLLVWRACCGSRAKYTYVKGLTLSFAFFFLLVQPTFFLHRTFRYTII